MPFRNLPVGDRFVSGVRIFMLWRCDRASREVGKRVRGG